MDPLQLRGIARFIVTIWAAWWTFFAASDMSAAHDTTEMKLTGLALTALVFAGSAALAWHCEHVGGVLLILEGVLACAAYPLGFFHWAPSTAAFVISTLALPPIAAGIMLLECWSHERRWGHPQGPHNATPAH